jgi:hypothetical protein
MRPYLASRLGQHDRDAALDPVTEASLDSERAWTVDLAGRLANVGGADGVGLSFEGRLERDALAARVRRELLDLEVLHPFQDDPGAYLPIVEGSVLPFLERRPGSPCTHLTNATRRLEHVPEVLRAAKINLRDPGRLATERAVERFDAALRVFREDLPASARTCRDPAIQASLSEADSGAVRAMVEFVEFLREDVAPRSRDSFALGGDACTRLLVGAVVEGAENGAGLVMGPRFPGAAPGALDSLLARGRRELERGRARMDELAALVAPAGGIRAALDSLASDRPADSVLVPHVEAELDTIRRFLVRRGIVTLSGRLHVRVREVPGVADALSPARLDGPGVWKRGGPDAWLSLLTLDPGGEGAAPPPGRPAPGRAALTLAAAREALPGRYVELLARQGARSRFRQAFPAADFLEGWASYGQAMLVEEGYGGGTARLELAERVAMALETARLVAAVSLHAKGMSLPEAERLFAEQCFLDPAAASLEARRAALDPEIAAAALGRWRILDLRDEVRSRLGGRFDLHAFHDALLRQSGLPLSLAGAAVLRELGGQGKP